MHTQISYEIVDRIWKRVHEMNPEIVNGLMVNRQFLLTKLRPPVQYIRITRLIEDVTYSNMRGKKL